MSVEKAQNMGKVIEDGDRCRSVKDADRTTDHIDAIQNAYPDCRFFIGAQWCINESTKSGSYLFHYKTPAPDYNLYTII